MCSPHVAVLCLFAPQRDMTATLELLKTQISDDYDHGNEGAGGGGKENRKHQGERRRIDDRWIVNKNHFSLQIERKELSLLLTR